MLLATPLPQQSHQAAEYRVLHNCDSQMFDNFHEFHAAVDMLNRLASYARQQTDEIYLRDLDIV